MQEIQLMEFTLICLLVINGYGLYRIEQAIRHIKLDLRMRLCEKEYDSNAEN